MNHRQILVGLSLLLALPLLVGGAWMIHPGLGLMAVGALLLGFALLGIDVTPPRPTRDPLTLRRSDR